MNRTELQAVCGKTFESIAHKGGAKASDPSQESPFIAEAKRQYELFALEAPGNLPMIAIGVGFDVLGRFGDACLKTYRRHIEATDRPFYTYELSSALKHPKTIRVLTWLASMDRRQNYAYELVFGLRNGQISISNDQFKYRTPEGYFEPSLQSILTAEETAPPPTVNASGCPAKRFIPEVWHSLVDNALNTSLISVES